MNKNFSRYFKEQEYLKGPGYLKELLIYSLIFSFITCVFFVIVTCGLATPSVEAIEPKEEAEYTRLRTLMVEKQLRSRDITDETVLRVMNKVPRHLFVPEDMRRQAYADHPLPIGEGQTISQPYIVALMTQWLKLTGVERTLEIGTGSGYQAAVLAEIIPQVYTIEIREKLGRRAEKVLEELGYRNVKVKIGDGYFGWEEYAPFDAIIITAAIDHVPPPLWDQLKEGGRMVMPLGSPFAVQSLMLFEKKDGKRYGTFICGALFVPLVRAEALK